MACSSARSEPGRALAALVAVALTAACGSEGAPDPGCPAPGAGRVVTADWLNRSLTALDLGRASDARCDETQAILDRIDLSAHAPGPIELELLPGGTSALVTIGPGFFAGAGSALVGSPSIEPGGGLLVVDLEQARVSHEIALSEVPMGLAVSPDGKRAFTANYGDGATLGSTVSVVDLEQGDELAAVVVGQGPEQIALTPDGTIGLVNLASEGAVRFFRTSDVQATLSPPVPTGSDPSDLAFATDVPRALVTNSQSFSVSVIDFAAWRDDPVGALPEVVATVATLGVPYAATVVPNTNVVLVGATLGTASVVAIDLGVSAPTASEPIPLFGSAFALSVGVDAAGRFAFVPHPAERLLSVLELDTGRTRGLTWLTDVGPTYVAVKP